MKKSLVVLAALGAVLIPSSAAQAAPVCNTLSGEEIDTVCLTTDATGGQAEYCTSREIGHLPIGCAHYGGWANTDTHWVLVDVNGSEFGLRKPR